MIDASLSTQTRGVSPHRGGGGGGDVGRSTKAEVVPSATLPPRKALLGGGEKKNGRLLRRRATDETSPDSTLTSCSSGETTTDVAASSSSSSSSSSRSWGGSAREAEASSSSSLLLPPLLDDVRRLSSLDRVLDARSAVDRIRSLLSSDPSLETDVGPSDRNLLDAVTSESDRVQFMLDDLRVDEEAGWIPCKHHKRDVTVHYKNEEGSPIHAVKTSTTLDGFAARDFVNLASIFVEADLMPQWFPGGVLKSADVLAAPSVYRQIIHMKMSFGRLSPLSDRDAVVEGRGYFLPDRNAVLVLSRSIDASEYCAIPPPDKGVVRIDTFSAFYVELLQGKRVLLRFIAHDDLKLKFVPSALLNYLQQGAMPVEMVRGIIGAVRNCPGSEWERRIRSRPEVYSDIERRAYGGGAGKEDGAAMSRDEVENRTVVEDSIVMAEREEAALHRGGGGGDPPALPPGHGIEPDWTAQSLIGTLLALIAAVLLARCGTRLSLALSVLPWSFYVSVGVTALLGFGWSSYRDRATQRRKDRERRRTRSPGGGGKGMKRTPSSPSPPASAAREPHKEKTLPSARIDRPALTSDRLAATPEDGVVDGSCSTLGSGSAGRRRRGRAGSLRRMSVRKSISKAVRRSLPGLKRRKKKN